MRVEREDQRSESDQPRCDIIKTKSKTKQQLLLEREELRTRLDVAEQSLQEANETLRTGITDHNRGEETFLDVQKYADSIVETIREPLLVLTAELMVKSANHSFYQTFQVTPILGSVAIADGIMLVIIGAKNKPWRFLLKKEKEVRERMEWFVFFGVLNTRKV